MPEQPFLRIPELLAFHAEQQPDAPAILAPGRSALSYSRLYQQVSETVTALNNMGIGRNDRVALVLPEGPDMAVALLAVSSGATSIPLNLAYNAEEFTFYLSAMKVKALIFQAGADSQAIAATHAADLP